VGGAGEDQLYARRYGAHQQAGEAQHSNLRSGLAESSVSWPLTGNAGNGQDVRGGELGTVGCSCMQARPQPKTGPAKIN